MESCGHSNPLLSFSRFIHQHCARLGAELATRFEDTAKQLTIPRPHFSPQSLFAFFSHPKYALAATSTLTSNHVAKSLTGTKVYTVSNSNNEFVLISDSADGAKSIGLLCFRQQDAEAFLSQVRSRKRELRGKARVVPITLDQQLWENAVNAATNAVVKTATTEILRPNRPHLPSIVCNCDKLMRHITVTPTVYMLKVEGIAFRFLPDPIQIKNALELRAAASKGGFDGVPVFQSDLLVVKKKNKRYCPVYFSKEDIEKEVSMISRRGPGISQHIMVGSLEDVLKKMEMSERNSGWEDLIFIPPGKSHSQHIQEINA